jgi:hypothetical protein
MENHPQQAADILFGIKALVVHLRQMFVFVNGRAFQESMELFLFPLSHLFFGILLKKMEKDVEDEK